MRVGKFYIDECYVEDYESFSEVLWKMKFVPVRVEHLFHKKQFEYVGYSVLFDDIPLGQSVSEYIIKFTLDENNKISISVNKPT